MNRTIPNLLAAAVDEAGDRPWLFHEDTVVTYGEAHRRVRTAAAALAALGLARGDRVLVPMRNTADHLFAWLALMELGAILVAANPAATDAEVAGLIAQTSPALIVADADLRATRPPTSPPPDAGHTAGRHRAAGPGVPAPSTTGRVPGPERALSTTGRGDATGRPGAADADQVPDAGGPRLVALAALSADGDPAAGPPPGPGPAEDDPAVLIPTSGTTGRSKLVTQTHRGYVLAGEGFPWWMELTADDRLMTSLPLFHINAPAYSVLGSVAARASLVLLPRFSPSTFLDSARRYGATEFNAIGAMIEMLMHQPERPDDAETPLRLAYTGPALPEARHLEVERRFGLRLVCGYAMSESPYGTIWPRGTRPYGTLGAIRQHPTLGVINEGRVMEVTGPATPTDPHGPADPEPGGERRVDPERGGDRRVAPGEVGELELRNPAVMAGYWGMPAETAAVLRPDGWLRTGDLVTEAPDGILTFVGRQKEIIRRRGENLAPAEVEEALAAHPGVAEVAVVGVPSELTEEEVKAFVVPADPADRPDPAALHAWAADRLTRFKVPRYIELVPELPHTPTGRVAKHRLALDRTPAEWDADA